MANLMYNRGKYLLGNGLNMATADLRVLLVNASYTAVDTHNVVSDVSTNEISVAGYARQALTTKAWTEDDANHQAYASADNATFTSLAAGQTVGGAILYVYNASDALANLVGFIDLTDTLTNGGNIVIQWATAANGGILKLS